MAYRIEYSPDTFDHFRTLTARQRAIVLDEVDLQLRRVLVRAIAVKERNRVRIGGKEIEL